MFLSRAAFVILRTVAVLQHALHYLLLHDFKIFFRTFWLFINVQFLFSFFISLNISLITLKAVTERFLFHFNERNFCLLQQLLKSFYCTYVAYVTEYFLKGNGWKFFLDKLRRKKIFSLYGNIRISNRSVPRQFCDWELCVFFSFHQRIV